MNPHNQSITEWVFPGKLIKPVNALLSHPNNAEGNLTNINHHQISAQNTHNTLDKWMNNGAPFGDNYVGPSQEQEEEELAVPWLMMIRTVMMMVRVACDSVYYKNLTKVVPKGLKRWI